MKAEDIHTEPLPDGTERVVIDTPTGRVQCVFHKADTDKGVIWLCGALGGLDGPSFGIFRILAERLVADGISSLRLHYHRPGDFDECVQDVLLGVDYLKQRGIDLVVLVGHSFGGAVAIQAGTMIPHVQAVVGLASQTYGARNAGNLSPRPLLLIHGERDRNLPAECSRQIYRWAKEPREVHILKGNGHFLREAHAELQPWLRDWLVARLGEAEARHKHR